MSKKCKSIHNKISNVSFISHPIYTKWSFANCEQKRGKMLKNIDYFSHVQWWMDDGESCLR